MAKRFTDTDKWNKESFSDLSLKMKLVWMYLCDRCDVAGVWDVNLRLASFLIGEPLTKEDLLALGDKIVWIETDKIFIPSFIEFQYGSQLSKTNNIYKSVERVLLKYDLFSYVTAEITNECTTPSARRNRISRLVRDRIFLESELICQYCSNQKVKAELVVDHFIPVNKGGDSSDDNLVCSCVRCNTLKSDLMPDIFLSKPHPFLKPTEKINSLLGAFKDLNRGFKPLLGAMDKDKDKDMDKVSKVGSSTREKFSNPAIQEVKDFFTENNGTSQDAERFFNHYESNGWMAGKTKMKKWTAAAKNWMSNRFNQTEKTGLILGDKKYTPR